MKTLHKFGDPDSAGWSEQSLIDLHGHIVTLLEREIDYCERKNVKLGGGGRLDKRIDTVEKALALIEESCR